MSSLQVIVLSILLTATVVSGQALSESSLSVRVVDVGSGSCSIVELPNDDGILILDAGHWRGSRCLNALKTIGKNKTVQLMVLSHSDADHIGDAASILSNYKVNTLLRTGVSRSSKTWQRFNQAVIIAENKGMKVYDASRDVLPGMEFSYGDVTATVIYGQHRWKGRPLPLSKARNAVSIVVRLEYAGQSILFPGDAIGREIGSPFSSCAYTEKAMVESSSSRSIGADILIAPHHGSDSSSSECFIKAVSPKYVVFQSGHKYGHPSRAVKDRYLRHGVAIENLFRTDLKDTEDNPHDWEDERYTGCKDSPGDDDIAVTITNQGISNVEYLTPEIDSCTL